MFVQYIVVDNHYVWVSGERCFAAVHHGYTTRFGQPFFSLAQPVYFKAGLADDQNGLGPLKIQQSQNLDRLAKTHRIGQQDRFMLRQKLDPGELVREVSQAVRHRHVEPCGRCDRLRIGNDRGIDFFIVPLADLPFIFEFSDRVTGGLDRLFFSAPECPKVIGIFRQR